MKIRPFRQSAHGFTLVELLVVISIIAVLAAAGLAGIKAAIDRAYKTKAMKMCQGIDTAVTNFYDEYGRLPLPSGSAQGNQDVEIITNGAQGIELLTILMGLEDDSDNMLNPKKIPFLDAPEGKRIANNMGKGGIIYSAGNRIQGLYDPWGQPYHILIDANYDNQIDNNPFATGNQPLRVRRVATYTYGKNKKNDQGGRDDVKSW
jgi:prepilin-type N-terminal cleavage/methylation domain-containing protein